MITGKRKRPAPWLSFGATTLGATVGAVLGSFLGPVGSMVGGIAGQFLDDGDDPFHGRTSVTVKPPMWASCLRPDATSPGITAADFSTATSTPWGPTS